MKPSAARANRGFSLIELLIVVAIIAIVISMLLVVFARVYHIVQSWK